jgi:DNA-binding NarL/FixJ family response regulator
MEGDRQKCLDAGCDDYLSKSVNKGKLSELLGKYLKGREDSDSLAAQTDALCDQTQPLADLCQQADKPRIDDPKKPADTPSDKQS